MRLSLLCLKTLSHPVSNRSMVLGLLKLMVLARMVYVLCMLGRMIRKFCHVRGVRAILKELTVMSLALGICAEDWSLSQRYSVFTFSRHFLLLPLLHALLFFSMSLSCPSSCSSSSCLCFCFSSKFLCSWIKLYGVYRVHAGVYITAWPAGQSSGHCPARCLHISISCSDNSPVLFDKLHHPQALASPLHLFLESVPSIELLTTQSRIGFQ